MSEPTTFTGRDGVQREVMTEGEVWRVRGLLCGDPFEISFDAWNSYDPESKARTLYENQTFLTNATVESGYTLRSVPVEVERQKRPVETTSPEEGGAA